MYTHNKTLFKLEMLISVRDKKRLQYHTAQHSEHVYSTISVEEKMVYLFNVSLKS